MAAEADGLCYNRLMSESSRTAAIGDAVLDGWALAAALDGGSDAVRACAPAFARALQGRTDALRDPVRKVSALRAWSRRAAPAVDGAMLAEAPPRVRALLAPLASAGARRDAAEHLASLPAPRPGYRPPGGFAAGLAARALRRSSPPTEAERGYGRKVLAALAGDERAEALLAKAGSETDAVARLADLSGGEVVDDPVVPFALMAAASHGDPVGRFGQLLRQGDESARELRELEAACRE